MKKCQISIVSMLTCSFGKIFIFSRSNHCDQKLKWKKEIQNWQISKLRCKIIFSQLNHCSEKLKRKNRFKIWKEINCLNVDGCKNGMKKWQISIVSMLTGAFGRRFERIYSLESAAVSPPVTHYCHCPNPLFLTSTFHPLYIHFSSTFRSNVGKDDAKG